MWILSRGEGTKAKENNKYLEIGKCHENKQIMEK